MMNQEMNTEENFHHSKIAKWCTVVATLVNGVLAPVSFLWSLMIGLNMYESSMNPFIRLIIALLVFSVPVVTLTSIFTMWSKYRVYRAYSKVYFLACLPLLFTIIVATIGETLETWFG